MAALAQVHRRGSFDLAAAALGLTPSAVSQRIKALEERMGTVLIRRSQPCIATEAGLRLIRHHDEVALLERTLAADLGQPARPATIRIAVTADSLGSFVIPLLAQVPDVLFDLVIDDQNHSQDWLRRGEVAGAITAHAGPLQGCDTHPLGALRYRATASPAYVARWFAGGVTVGTLGKAPGLTYDEKDRLQSDWIHARTGRRLAYPTHRMAATHAFVDACLAGMGWGMNPEPLVAAHLASGALVELVPDTPLDTPLYWQVARLTAPALAGVTAAMRRTRI